MLEIDFPSPRVASILLAVATVLHVWGLISTSFRLWFRYHIGRFWWDDFWAAFALLWDAVCLAALWTPPDDPLNLVDSPLLTRSRSAHIIAIWLSLLSYTCVLWFARISIVSSVVRIVPPSRYVCVAAFGSGGLFFCMWAYMLVCKLIVCAVDKSWYNATIIQCPLPEWITLSEVCTDVLSDVVLVSISLRLLWRVKLPSNQRIMVLSVFSTSILVSVVSAIHTAYMIPRVTFIGMFIMEVGAAFSLIVCNLLVIVTFVYRVVRNGRDLTAGLSKKATESSNRLTTVDLEFVGLSCETAETSISSVVFRSPTHSGGTMGSLVASGGSVLPDASSRLAPISEEQ